jgi:hypothetical protein
MFAIRGGGSRPLRAENARVEPGLTPWGERLAWFAWGRSSRTVTSTFSSGLLLGVAPAVVELTMGPADVTCVPGFGGWPSRRPGSVRVPVVAGFETRVSMKCHR